MNRRPSEVLLVEDDLRLPEILVGLLHEDDVALSSAKDATEALAMVRQKHPD